MRSIKKLEGVWDAEGAESARKIFLQDLQQLDEPKPVKVPQVVAEKIEYFKKSGDWDLFQAMDYMFEEKEIKEWLEDKDIKKHSLVHGLTATRSRKRSGIGFPCQKLEIT